jgi:hypothetical protein
MKCCYCHRDLPIEAFPLKYGRVRYKSCRECYALGHSCLRPEPKPKRPKLSPEEKKAHRKAYMLEYQRKYRAANREKVREFSRDSNRRRRGGEEKRKSGPQKGCKFTKQDFTERPVPTKEPVKAGRLCQQCINWPCFAGIENLETDFAKEGCHAFRQRGEAS